MEDRHKKLDKEGNLPKKYPQYWFKVGDAADEFTIPADPV